MTMLFNMFQQYKDLNEQILMHATYVSDERVLDGLRAKQTTLIRQMKLEMSRLSPTAVPNEISKFLSKH